MVVYSRWCGELISDIQHCGAKRGLSPLARGTHERGTPGRLIVRFIPAGAGNSATRWQSSYPTTVYPRWRGELLIRSSYSAPLAGLSPLARGTQHGRPYEIPVARFIPAGAGNSHPSRNNAFIFPVYPRWRGELLFYSARTGTVAGLSPLARGTLISLAIINRLTRFIPAGAGNSRARGDSGRACTVYPRWRGELTKHNLLLIIDFLSQSQSTNLTETHKQHIHYVKEHLIH
ncbi:Domain of uncharacterised function (DUF2825) [Escherichia coli]|nr:Domain of uncharacterised function (DUF2825) [Escherichia coli]